MKKILCLIIFLISSFLAPNKNFAMNEHISNIEKLSDVKKSKNFGYGWYNGISLGKLYFLYGTMGAGKSAMLIDKFKAFKRSQFPTYVYLPKSIDSDEISSRNRKSIKTTCSNLKDVPIRSILFVDEAQFLDNEEIEDIEELLSTKNVAVLCFGLLTTYKKDFFESSLRMLDLAYAVREIPMLCEKCKFAHAMYNFRKSFDDSLFVPDKDLYISLCPDCFATMSHLSKLWNSLNDD